MTGGLNVQVEGPEGAPWIVLSNSLGADLSMWEAQMPLLVQHRRVLRYDTRGHGKSAAPAGGWGFPDLVADVVALMDAQGIARADFMGLSLGGMTGLGLAITHPARVERLVCADARADAPDGFRANWDARIAKVSATGTDSIADATLESWLTPDWRAVNPEASSAVRAMIAATGTPGYVGCCAALKTLDYLKDLGKITAPTLYICGEHDKGAPPDVMRAMAKATPEAQFALIPDAAHVANINNAQAFNAAVARFLWAD